MMSIVWYNLEEKEDGRRQSRQGKNNTQKQHNQRPSEKKIHNKQPEPNTHEIDKNDKRGGTKSS